jgi:hemoglobin/transferrin/lactoferrin receptor protein
MKFLSEKKLNVLVFFFSFVSFLSAQIIHVVDSNSGESIENVAIFSIDKTKSVITDYNGKASVDEFNLTNSLIFQINGYFNLTTKLSVTKKSYIIQLDPKVQNLDGVILSVARSMSKKNKIAEKVNIINSEKIQKSIIQTSADILELSPGVRVQKSQGGGGSPVLRGFEANRVLLVIDGVRMNNAIYRSGHIQNAITIAPHNLERVEIIFGPSSVGYGSDALGGVIHYYTKTPDINSDIKNKNEFHSDFNSANLSSVNNITSNWSFEKWGAITSISFSNFGDIRMGKKNSHGFNNWGLTNFFSENTNSFFKATPSLNPNPLIQKKTGYKQFDLFQKFRFKLNNQSYLSLNVQLSNSSNINRYDKLNEIRNENLRYAEWYYGPQKRFLFSPKFEFFNGSPLLRKGSLTLAYQNIKESRVDRKFNSFNRSYQFEEVSVMSFNADFSARPAENLTSSYGLEILNNIISSDAFSKSLSVSNNEIISLSSPIVIPTRYPSNGSYYDSAALYLNFVWEFNDFLSLNAGSRLTYTDLGGSWNEEALVNTLLSKVSVNNWALTSTVAMIYTPIEKIQLNVLLSSGFRNPNIDDIGKIRESGGSLIVPNPFLKPEYAYNLDVGLSFESENGFNRFSVRGFGSLISRHIVRSDYTIYSDESTNDPNTIIYDGEELPTLANKNLGNRYIYGGSFEGLIRFSDKFYTRANITYTHGDKSFKNGPIPSIPPLFGQYGVYYSGSKIDAQLEWNFSNAKNANNYSYGGEDGLDETPLINEDQYAGAPAWKTFSISTNYEYNEKVVFKCGINNIFDTHYRTFASGISQPGRSLQIGVSLDF